MLAGQLVHLCMFSSANSRSEENVGHDMEQNPPHFYCSFRCDLHGDIANTNADTIQYREGHKFDMVDRSKCLHPNNILAVP